MANATIEYLHADIITTSSSTSKNTHTYTNMLPMKLVSDTPINARVSQIFMLVQIVKLTLKSATMKNLRYYLMNKFDDQCRADMNTS